MAVWGLVGTILLTLLKIVLILLLLVLAIVLLALFVPVRYGMWLEKGEVFTARARVSWLCRIVNFRVLYEKGKTEFTLRVFGINLLAWLQKRRDRAEREEEDAAFVDGRDMQEGQKAEKDLGQGALQAQETEGEAIEEADISMAEVSLPGQKEEQRQGGQKKEEQRQKEQKQGEQSQKGQSQEEQSQEEQSQEEQSREEQRQEEQSQEEQSQEEQSQEEQSQEEQSQEEQKQKEQSQEDDGDSRQRAGNFFKRLAAGLRRLWEELLRRLQAAAAFFRGLRRMAGKLRRRAEWLGDVKDFLRSENTGQMVCIFRDNVLHLWRKLKPRTVKGQVRFGTGDPCSTGQILGVCAIVFACYGNGIAVTPEFERQIFEGELMLKGRLSLITAVVIIGKLFFSRQWKTFRREWDVIGGSWNE